MTEMPEVESTADREIIIPPGMERLAERAGYAPAIGVGRTLYCAGQVGRTPALEVISDPEAQFQACWENLRSVLADGGCTFDDIVDLTTYHVNLHRHMEVFRKVKDAAFPRSTAAWTVVGVADLAHPGLLVEIQCTAVQPARPHD